MTEETKHSISERVELSRTATTDGIGRHFFFIVTSAGDAGVAPLLGGAEKDAPGFVSSSSVITISSSREQVKKRAPLFLSELDLKELCVRDEGQFVGLTMNPLLSLASLSLAAEIAGTLLSKSKAIPMLLHLVQHSSELVREGAIYGLSALADQNDSAHQAIVMHSRAENEPSSAVREAALASLEM